jgi:hypothetical protein
MRFVNLIEAQRIDDAIPGKGVDHEALLIAQDHLLRLGIEVQHAPIEIDGVLNERNFYVQAGVLNHPLRIAELQHQRLLGLVHREQGAEQEHENDRRERAQPDQDVAIHC